MASVTIVKAIMRIAKKQADPEAWLEAIIEGRFTSAIDEGGKTLVSTNVDGQSFQWGIPKGLSEVELIELAERALQHIENETEPTTTGVAYFG